jgi:DNA-binding transcriptional ArsR family regulator
MTAMFDTLAHPVRQEILAELRVRPRTVNELVEALQISQPLASKHLRVLRDAGFVAAVADAQRRRYQLRAEPFIDLARWLEPYRWMWEDRLDLLGERLDEMRTEEEL